MVEHNGNTVEANGVNERSHGLAEVVSEGVAMVASGLGPMLPKLDELRVDSRGDEGGLVVRRQVVIEVTKSKPDCFIRVNPSTAHTATLRLHESADRCFYLLNPQMDYGLRGFGKDYIVYTAVTRTGEVFLLPVPPRVPGSRANAWLDSKRVAVEKAKTHWVRIVSDQDAGAYYVLEAKADLGDPVWPTDDLETRVHRAFADRFIKSLDHPIVRRLQGLE